jgi:hypothetical protein
MEWLKYNWLLISFLVPVRRYTCSGVCDAPPASERKYSSATGLWTGNKTNKEKQIMKKIFIHTVTIAFVIVLALSVANIAKASTIGYPVDQKRWEAWWQDGQATKQEVRINPSGYPVDQRKWEAWWRDGRSEIRNVKAQPLDYPVDEICWQTHAGASAQKS